MKNQDLALRISRLETSAKWYKRLAFTCLLVVGAFLTLGQTNAPGRYTAEQFTLTNSKGAIVGKWEATASGSCLTFLDANGTARLLFTQMPHRQAIQLLDANATSRVEVSLAGQEPGIRILDANRRVRAGIGLSLLGPGIELRDGNGRKRIGMVVTDAGPGFSLLSVLGKSLLGMVVAQNTPSMILNREDGKILWAAPQKR